MKRIKISDISIDTSSLFTRRNEQNRKHRNILRRNIAFLVELWVSGQKTIRMSDRRASGLQLLSYRLQCNIPVDFLTVYRVLNKKNCHDKCTYDGTCTYDYMNCVNLDTWLFILTCILLQVHFILIYSID